jgi:hypothetical protein
MGCGATTNREKMNMTLPDKLDSAQAERLSARFRVLQQSVHDEKLQTALKFLPWVLHACNTPHSPNIPITAVQFQSLSFLIAGPHTTRFHRARILMCAASYGTNIKDKKAHVLTSTHLEHSMVQSPNFTPTSIDLLREFINATLESPEITDDNPSRHVEAMAQTHAARGILL